MRPVYRESTFLEQTQEPRHERGDGKQEDAYKVRSRVRRRRALRAGWAGQGGHYDAYADDCDRRLNARLTAIEDSKTEKGRTICKAL